MSCFSYFPDGRYIGQCCCFHQLLMESGGEALNVAGLQQFASRQQSQNNIDPSIKRNYLSFSRSLRQYRPALAATLRINFIAKLPQNGLEAVSIYIIFPSSMQSSQQVCIQSGCEQSCFAPIDSNIDSELHTHRGHPRIHWDSVLLSARKYTSEKLLAQQIQGIVTQSLDRVLEAHIQRMANTRFRNLLQGQMAQTLEKIVSNSPNETLTGDQLFAFVKLATYNPMIEQIGTHIDSQCVSLLLRNIQNQLKCFAQKNEDFAYQCFLKGWANYSEEKLFEAIQCYTRAIDLNPQNPEFFFQRGFVYHSQGKHDLAEIDYKSSLRINDLHASSLMNLGLIESNRENNLKALELYNRSIQANPSDPVCYNNRGYIYYKLHRYRDALADLTESIALEPSKGSYEFRSQIQRKLGKKREAEKDLYTASRL